MDTVTSKVYDHAVSSSVVVLLLSFFALLSSICHFPKVEEEDEGEKCPREINGQKHTPLS